MARPLRLDTLPDLEEVVCFLPMMTVITACSEWVAVSV